MYVGLETNMVVEIINECMVERQKGKAIKHET